MHHTSVNKVRELMKKLTHLLILRSGGPRAFQFAARLVF